VITMNREQPTVPQWVCVHCFIHLVNGDCTEPDTCPGSHREPTPDDHDPLHLFGDMPITPGMLFSEHSCGKEAMQDVHPDFECDCETNTFSWSSCDGCGSSLGGERHAVTGWIKE